MLIENSNKYQMTKELHLSQIHQPYANESNEKYCRRWISTRLIHELREKGLPKETKYLADAQISNYWESPNSYLCFTIAKRDRRSPNQLVSVTIGLLITDQLKKQFRFLNDPNIKNLQVNTTCERCTMPNCESRAAPLRENFEKNGKQELLEALQEIDGA